MKIKTNDPSLLFSIFILVIEMHLIPLYKRPTTTETGEGKATGTEERDAAAATGAQQE